MANEFKIKTGLISPKISITDTTVSTSTTTGALTVAGGAGIQGDMWVGGTLHATVSSVANLAGGTAGQVPYQTAPGVTSFYGPGTAGNVLVSNGTSAPTYNNTLSLSGTTGSTSTTTGTLTVGGGVGVAENLYVGGNGVFGSGLTFTPANSNIQTAGSVNSFFQLAVQNKNAGTLATSDIAAFADNGDDTSGFIDMGITSSGYNDPTYSLSGPGDGFLYVTGKSSTVGNLVISTYTPKDIIFSTGGGATANELGRWKHGQGLTIKATTSASGPNSGALQVSNGGAFIAGDLYVGGTINLSGVAVQQIGQITTTAAGWNLP